MRARLDLPFCRDFDSTEASTGKHKRLARVKSVMGKAKKKQIKETNKTPRMKKNGIKMVSNSVFQK
jgi:hypothetical protein